MSLVIMEMLVHSNSSKLWMLATPSMTLTVHEPLAHINKTHVMTIVDIAWLEQSVET